MRAGEWWTRARWHRQWAQATAAQAATTLVELGSVRQRNRKWTRRALDVKALVLSADGGAGQAQGTKSGHWKGCGANAKHWSSGYCRKAHGSEECGWSGMKMSGGPFL